MNDDNKGVSAKRRLWRLKIIYDYSEETEGDTLLKQAYAILFRLFDK